MPFKQPAPICLSSAQSSYIDDESEPESKEVRSVNVAEWLKEGESVLTLPPGPEEEDLAALVYTSGTTGKT